MITQKCAVSLAANALFMLISFVALYLCELVSYYKYIGLIIAAVLTVVAICLTLLAKSKTVFGVIAFVLNALAFGCAACSVFLYTGTFPKIWAAAACLGGYALLFYAFCLAANTKIIARLPALWIALLVVVLVAAGITGIVLLPETGVFQLATFSLISFAVFISTTAYRARDIDNHLLHMTFASFVLAIIAIIIAIIVVSEGEVLDGADGSFVDFNGVGKSARRRNPFDYRTDIAP